MQTRENLKRTIVSLKAQHDEAQSCNEVHRVKARCLTYNIKFDKLSLDDRVFYRAMENDQLEPFLIK